MNKKKVLLITYYWPPCGGIGVLRCLKFAKYLRQYGWEPIIFTADNAHYPSIDHSNDRDIPEGIIVLKQRIWEPYHIYKFLTRQKADANVNNVFYVKDKKLGPWHRWSVWIRSNFFIPDARALWIRPSVKFLLRYLKEHPVDAILSNGPPHSNTRIATLIKQKTGIPWLADFQDPWTQIDYYQLLKLTRWGDARHRRMEQEAFAAADKITIASPSWKADLEELGAQHVSTQYWGFDPDDYKGIEVSVDQKFTFTHLGILGYDRNPKVFFEVLGKLCEHLPGFRNDLCIQLVGQVDFSVTEAYQQAGITDQIELLGFVPRQKALELTLSSPILLLLLNQQDNAKGRIPGKLFEYLASNRPTLCLGCTDSDVANILRTTKRGETINYEDRTQIKTILLQYYHQFKEGQLEKALDSDISAYSNKRLTGKIAGYLDEISTKNEI